MGNTYLCLECKPERVYKKYGNFLRHLKRQHKTSTGGFKARIAVEAQGT